MSLGLNLAMSFREWFDMKENVDVILGHRTFYLKSTRKVVGPLSFKREDSI